MTYNEATDLLPADSVLTSTFGYPGEGGYNEFHRAPDGTRWVISNGDYFDCQRNVWTISQVMERVA